MKLYLRRLLSWPSVFAILFFSLPPLLFYWHPSSFWVGTDYEPLGLGDALNLAYRIADRHMYPAVGMSYHPGVPFYFVSWLALALTGYPVAFAGSGFFNEIIEHIEDYHQITIFLGALTGAAGIYVFARAALNLVPAGVVAIGLLIWLVSTPATLLMFISPSIDSFAIVINGLFFAVLLRIAYDREVSPSSAILAGCVGALAYLNKLSYVYIPLTLVVIGILIFAFRRIDWLWSRRIAVILAVASLFVTYATASWLAQDRGIALGTLILSKLGGVLAYLNRFYYTYIPLAFIITGTINFFFSKIAWIRTSVIAVVFVLAFLTVIYAVGYLIIGSEGFHDFLQYHQKVIFGSGLYGTGQEDVVSRDEVWRAFAAIPVEKTYAVLIALVGGAGLVVAGLVTGLRGSQHVPAAVVSMGAGLASVLSAGIVMKHYALHYTAGVSATLPAGVVGGYLLAKAWGFYRFRIVGTALAAIAILFMAGQTMPPLISTLVSRTTTTQLAKADLQEIYAHLAGTKRTVEFAYKAPFSWYGEGFVIIHASVPRLNADYLQSRSMISSLTAGLANREIGAYVIDKGYFPTLESVKASPNVALLSPTPVAFKDGDKLIELRTVYLLIPGS